jgi:hypothetical protein
MREPADDGHAGRGRWDSLHIGISASRGGRSLELYEQSKIWNCQSALRRRFTSQ